MGKEKNHTENPWSQWQTGSIRRRVNSHIFCLLRHRKKIFIPLWPEVEAGFYLGFFWFLFLVLFVSLIIIFLGGRILVTDENQHQLGKYSLIKKTILIHNLYTTEIGKSLTSLPHFSENKPNHACKQMQRYTKNHVNLHAHQHMQAVFGFALASQISLLPLSDPSAIWFLCKHYFVTKLC